VNLKEDVVEVYSQPVGGEYRQVRKVSRGDELELHGELSGTLVVDDVLGEEVRWAE
jgi:hypothetical protein